MNIVKKRAAIFQAYHTLQVHTKYFVEALVEAGYEVDVFLFHCESSVEKPDFFRATVYDYSYLKPKWRQHRSISSQLSTAFRFFFVEPILGSESAMLSAKVLQETASVLKANKYNFFVGIEKMGLAWAGFMGNNFAIPYFYYSLELYLDDYLRTLQLGKKLRFLTTRKLEKKYHTTASGTIIQDEIRERELNKANNVLQNRSVYLPVSIKGDVFLAKSDYLRKKYSIPLHKKIILQFGIISKERFSDCIAKAAQKLSDEYIVIMHGPLMDKVHLDEIMKIDLQRKVILSYQMLPSSEINEIIKSADIGLCFYGTATKNEYHAGFASEKLARYYQAGVPVIAFNYPTFQQSVEQTGGGVCISHVDQLKEAVDVIMHDYDKYKNNALIAYQKYFQFENQFSKIISFLEK